MLTEDRTPLPSDRARGTLARVARDDTELADQLLRQRLKERLFGEAGPAPMIGGYTLERRVGEGGMGVVYRAHDAELQRSVALKLMHPELGGAAERIRGEARALARLAHPNVVSVHEIGEHEGRLFVAMEFVEGETLRGWIERQRGKWGPGAAPGLAELLGLIVQAARGLQAAHAAGLVHRDFKPENVLVGADGRVRVVDFGIASQVGAAAAAEEVTADLVAPIRTRTGEIVGTPAYMAPEQFTGGPVDARTDQFALCVTLYEALCGERPFAGATVQQLMTAVVAGQLRPPPRWLPASLRAALERGLAREPQRRFADMGGLIAALTGAGARRWPRWLAPATGGLGLVVLAGVLVQLAGGDPPPVSEDMSQAPAGPPLWQRAWALLPALCLPEPPATDVVAQRAKLQALVPLARAQPEHSGERRALEAEMAAGLVVLPGEVDFACKWSRELLAEDPSGPSAARLGCLLRHHCGAPAAVVCPTGLVNEGPHGCAPIDSCGVSGVVAQTAACRERGDAACCSSALIVREYDMLEAGVAATPESRAELGALAERACAAGVAQACTQAVELGVTGSAALLRRGCALGRVAACGPSAERTARDACELGMKCLAPEAKG